MNIKNVNLYNIFWLCHKILGIMSIIYFVYIVYFVRTFVLYSNTEGICTNNKCTFPTLSIYNYNNCLTFNSGKGAEDPGGKCYYCIQIHDYIYVSTKNDKCINLYTILTSILYYFTIPTIIKLIFFYNYHHIANKIIFYNQIVNVKTLQTPLLQQFSVCYLCLNSLCTGSIYLSSPDISSNVIIKTYCNHYFCYECMLKWKKSNCTHCPKCLQSIYL
jgi:hypothetical protein